MTVPMQKSRAHQAMNANRWKPNKRKPMSELQECFWREELSGPTTIPMKFYDTGGRYIVPFFEVKGHPSKKGLPMAHEWMRERNCEWDGSTKSLRAEIVRALLRGETVPKFGLAIRLTLQIRKD
ncbi:hypothetical protein ACVWZW_009053 [Bradyrhizobium sp. F1.13.4]